MVSPYSPPLPTATTGPYVICIGREIASGGRQIGKLLSQRLGMTYYDSEILSLAADHSGMSREVFLRSDEHRGLLHNMLTALTPVPLGSNEIYGEQLSSDHLFALQSQAIRKAADEHSCIFIGRAADYVLRQHPRCISIFISANTEDRLQRIMEKEGVNHRTALRMLNIGDRKRADFYNFYSQGTWGAADTYHLLINSSVMGISATADFIADFARKTLHIGELTQSN